MVSRVAGAVVLALALGGFFVAGSWANAWFNPWKTPTHENSSKARNGQPAAPDSPQPGDTPRAEPRAEQARTAVIRRDVEAVEGECQRAAGGDWEQWQRDTAPYRARLKARIAAVREFPGDRPGPLEGRDRFPLFEFEARRYLNYLHDPTTLDEFRRTRAVVAAHRWLRQRGIDLIFVPAPRMTELYVDHFLEPCPADGIIAPHVRRTLLELLNGEVEVVDGLRLFRALRDTDAEYLYNAADTHWGPRGTRIMAKEIADRIGRYAFGARARFAVPIVQALPAPYFDLQLINRLGGFGGIFLTAEQKERAAQGQSLFHVHVSMQGGSLPRDPGSPVVVIGNSFTWELGEQLIKEMNLLTNTHAAPDQTTESFGDFLREPELLNHCRVVVWVTSDHHFTRFKPMPAPIMKALE
jgi:hypothetical protein